MVTGKHFTHTLYKHAWLRKSGQLLHDFQGFANRNMITGKHLIHTHWKHAQLKPRSNSYMIFKALATERNMIIGRHVIHTLWKHAWLETLEQLQHYFQGLSNWNLITGKDLLHTLWNSAWLKPRSNCHTIFKVIGTERNLIIGKHFRFSLCQIL